MSAKAWRFIVAEFDSGSGFASGLEYQAESGLLSE